MDALLVLAGWMQKWKTRQVDHIQRAISLWLLPQNALVPTLQPFLGATHARYSR